MKKKEKDIIIANPIYDVVFKSLMTTGNGINKENAGFFIGTILGEEITDIDFLSQEFPYHTKPKMTAGKELSLIRLDFVATVLTKGGEHKKVLIEIQKSQKSSDLLRFRTYLGEQYKQVDTVQTDGSKKEQTMPIVIIYMLGFTLPKIDTIAVKINRTYVDIIHGGELNVKSPFIESLTHDGYFIQIPRITGATFSDWENCSKLVQMLSLFEQDYFTEKNFYKRYPYPLTDKNIKRMVETLKYIVADPVTRRIMQEEYWAALNETLWENQVKAQSDQIELLSSENAAQSDQIELLSSENAAQSDQIELLSSENAAQSDQIAELHRILRQAGIDPPSG